MKHAFELIGLAKSGINGTFIRVDRDDAPIERMIVQNNAKVGARIFQHDAVLLKIITDDVQVVVGIPLEQWRRMMAETAPSPVRISTKGEP